MTEKTSRTRRTPEQIAQDLLEKENKLIADGEAAAKVEVDLKKQLSAIQDKLMKARATKKAGRAAAARQAYAKGYKHILRKLGFEKEFNNAYAKSEFDDVEKRVIDRITGLLAKEFKPCILDPKEPEEINKTEGVLI